MFWIFVLVGTLGIVLTVPTVLRTVDGIETSKAAGVIGFGATTFALTGYVFSQTSMGTLRVFILAMSIGVGVGVGYPEAIKALGIESNRTIETDPPPTGKPLNKSLSDEAI